MKQFGDAVLTALVCGAAGAGIALVVGAAWDWVFRSKKTKVQP